MADEDDFAFDEEPEDDFFPEDIPEELEEPEADVEEPTSKRHKSGNEGLHSHPKLPRGTSSLPSEEIWARRIFVQKEELQLSADHELTLQINEVDTALSAHRVAFPLVSSVERTENEAKKAIIRLFGVTSAGHSILVHVHGFLPYFYIAAWPDFHIASGIAALGEALNLELKASNRADKALKRPVLTVEAVQRQSIWGYHKESSALFLKITLAIPSLVPTARRILERGLNVAGAGKRNFVTYESNLPFILRFLVDLNLSGASWLSLRQGWIWRSLAERTSRCQIEVDCHWQHIQAHEAQGQYLSLAPVRVLSFDIECQGRQGHFPSPDKDPVIQIAAHVGISLALDPPFLSIIFTLKGCSPVAGSLVHSCATEEQLLLSFLRFWILVDADVITGYNVINFDLCYLLDRAKALDLPHFPYLGRIVASPSTVKNAKFESKAYGIRENKEIKMEGRIQLDVLDVIRREYKLRSYTLNSVSAHFLGQQKEDVHYSIISDLQNGNDETRHRLAVYCLKDAILPLRLMSKLLLFINLSEMSRVTGVPIVYLLTRGQQIKVISQLYRASAKHALVIPVKHHPVSEDKYEGATVIEPKKAYYKEPIATLDFASLYPSIMMAHNLCYSTLVARDDVATLPSNSFVRTPTGDCFVKKSVKQGLLPEILTELLNARSLAKKQMKATTDTFTEAVLNGRQLALKISANCMTAEDHEILTCHGFMTLDQLLVHFQTHRTLSIACYVEGKLQYAAITVADVIQHHGTHDVIVFGEDSGGNTPRNNLSVRVTGNHRMYVRIGSSWSNRIWPYNVGQSQEDAAPPFRVIQATSVRDFNNADSSVIAQFESCFPNGIASCIQTRTLEITSLLGLQTDDQFDAFVELYGYWLGDGWLDGSCRALAFQQSKVMDSDYLSSLFLRIGFHLLTDDERRPGANGAYIAPRPTQIVQRTHYGAYVGIGHQHYIYHPAWWSYFLTFCGHKYQHPKVRSNAFDRSTKNVIDKLASKVVKSAHTLIANTSPVGHHKAQHIQDHNRTSDNVCYNESCHLAGHCQQMSAFSSHVRKSGVLYEGRCNRDKNIKPSERYNAKRQRAADESDAAIKLTLDAGDKMFDSPDVEDIKRAKWIWDWCFVELNARRARLLLQGLRMANGTTALADVNHMCIKTSSGRFAEQILRMALHAGYTAVINRRHKVTKTRGLNQHGKPTRVQRTGYSVDCSRFIGESRPKLSIADEVKQITYTGTVWCVNVPIQPNLIMIRRVVERDGKRMPLRPVVIGNSVYGFTGAQVGQLPCLSISSSVTAFGRDMIMATKEAVEQHFTRANGYPADADVIYGDTDSVMVRFGSANVATVMTLGAEAAAFVTQQFIAPIRLEFEKVYFPYLLMNKKRYAGLYWTKADHWDKMDTKGIETVRRDNCALVSNVIETCLQTILVDRKPEQAIEFVKRIISDLLCNRLDLSLLVISKSLAKSASSEGYANKQAHVELAERMRKRDPCSAPVVGDRVAYVITKAAKGVPAYERAEDPIYVLEHSVPIDTTYYLTNQLQQPLQRIFEPILNPTQLKSLFAGDHTRTVKVAAPKTGGIMQFAVKNKTCMGCKVPLDAKDGELCKHCEKIKPEIYLKRLDAVREHEELYARTWTQCQSCQGSLHLDILCTSRDCPIFYRRTKVKHDLTEAVNLLQRFSF